MPDNVHEEIVRQKTKLFHFLQVIYVEFVHFLSNFTNQQTNYLHLSVKLKHQLILLPAALVINGWNY